MAYWDDPGYKAFMRETYGSNWGGGSDRSTGGGGDRVARKSAIERKVTSTSKSSSSSRSEKSSSSGSSTKALTDALAQAKRTYHEALARGDTATMETAKRAADVYRSQGADEAAANQQVYGTATPSASDWARINQSYSGSGRSSSSGGSGTTSGARTTAQPATVGTVKSEVAAGTPTTGKAYDKYIKAYGSAEAFGAEIKRKRAAGLPFDDPEAVTEFERDYPGIDTGQLVGTGVAGGVAGFGNLGSANIYAPGPGSAQAAPSPTRTVEQPSSPPPITIELPKLPELPSVPPAVITQPPQVEVPAGTTPETQAPPPVEEKDRLSKGPGGFVERITPLANVPSVEELYNLYKDVTGQESEAVKQYLGSQQFQGVLGGAIPLWMRNDPVWRLYLTRLGYDLTGSADTLKRSRQEAIRRRLAGEQ
ncbi:hypothetical protein [Gelria sp. Kuro-4]|uniref:hypothetical protein n=1 Tax=Gelria sp. Kuro-4 TaxID=2796927 RepID=UPI001BF04E40|nr:hypothetical protein [Gelria sp. Kuro-4]BCV23294.1 hypothetical protein kuro4_00670 [Gelria sp. Kuro-4]